MADTHTDFLKALTQYAPFDALPRETVARIVPNLTTVEVAQGDALFNRDQNLDGLYIVMAGRFDVRGDGDEVVTQRGPGDIMGERGLLRKGAAMLTAVAAVKSRAILLPADDFADLMAGDAGFAAWFERSAPTTTPAAPTAATGLTALHVRDLMARTPITCAEDATISDVARIMRDNRISSVMVVQDDALTGIITKNDLTNKVLAEGLSADLPVAQVMTRNPITIAPTDVGLDALMMLADNKISHLPVQEHGRLIGLIGSTDLVRKQAATASHMISELVKCDTAEQMAALMTNVPEMLVQLVGSGARHESITRRITDLTDAITRRLLALGEARLGPAPVRYLWAACGSQGRREQTGVSDQDNCLIIDDAMTPEDDAYFAALAKFVSDGLNTCGFVYCPGDMMATADRWRQPLKVWRGYFDRWIAQPDTEAQMLASVMFDLRPIGGDAALFHELQAETLRMARGNSIFVAHMIANSLKHSPPISLFRGFSLIRSGEHKNMLDLKHTGVVPVVDLGRVYTLQGGLTEVNTRSRLEAARDAGVVSASGAHDLIDAYDLIAETRLQHQARQIRAGDKPDNFMAPDRLSDLERSHLRDAFMVIKTMQSALGHSQGA
ncbi:putative nucleotidyltransferase substrate binding domain-containing protein [Actibacterium sp.]|uniref:putative nucleotidyltransferase substrate binding domain-containing protein n=1 Tax=Actibacterium sp. TaxID=1872125 RepID=UPI00356B050F